MSIMRWNFKNHTKVAGIVCAALLTVVGLCSHAMAGSAQLIMFEQDPCQWCDAWNEEIGTAYPNSWEGKLAPLRRVDIHAAKPADIAHVRRARYTPTFVLLVDGEEHGRLRGYAGADFFWPMLDELLNKAGLQEPAN